MSCILCVRIIAKVPEIGVLVEFRDSEKWLDFAYIVQILPAEC